MIDKDEVEIITTCPNCNREISYDENCPCGFDDYMNGRDWIKP
jgi:hypothetical protein